MECVDDTYSCLDSIELRSQVGYLTIIIISVAITFEVFGYTRINN